MRHGNLRLAMCALVLATCDGLGFKGRRYEYFMLSAWFHGCVIHPLLAIIMFIMFPNLVPKIS